MEGTGTLLGLDEEGCWAVRNGYGIKEHLRRAGFRWEPGRQLWIASATAPGLEIARRFGDSNGSFQAVFSITDRARRRIAAESHFSPCQTKAASAAISVARIARVSGLPGHPATVPGASAGNGAAGAFGSAGGAMLAEDLPDLPAPPGLEYFEHQRVAARLVAHYGSLYLADEMGLGKTITAIGAIQADRKLRSVMIVCPAVVRRHWQAEITKWLVPDERWPDTAAAVAVQRKTQGDVVKAPWLVLSWEAFTKLSEKLQGVDALVLDEAHFIKSHKSRRARAASSYVRRMQPRLRLLLSGTPAPTKPIELRSQLALLGRDGPHADFARWRSICQRPGFGMSGCRQKLFDRFMDELRQRGLFVRREASQLPSMPALDRSQVIVEPDAAGLAILDEWKRTEEGSLTWLAIEQAAEAARFLNHPDSSPAADPQAWETAVASLRAGMRVPFPMISRVRELTGRAKAPAVAAWIETLHGASKGFDRLVVFAHHRAVLDELEERFRASLGKTEILRLDGQTPDSDRQSAIRRFQDLSQGPALILVSTHAGGHGISLVSAKLAIVAEPDWNASIAEQAEARLARLGQKSLRVQARYMVLDGSLDARMLEIAQAKARMARAWSVAAANGDGQPEQTQASLPFAAATPETAPVVIPPPASPSSASSVQAPSTPVPLVVLPPPSPSPSLDPPSDRSLAASAVTPCADRPGEEPMRTILACLQALSESRDGHGFEPSDRVFGESLARQARSRGSLSRSQREWALRLLSKYSDRFENRDLAAALARLSATPAATPATPATPASDPLEPAGTGAGTGAALPEELEESI